ncbi:H-NS family nucleoid-associated regulatory protein [Roseomonas sp. BN140053]|uniref:H-NS histone family protein n=1 Tax=Roseomonas sp. BN140053 TaxID=3391898 RepID=UPI0039E7FACA
MAHKMNLAALSVQELTSLIHDAEAKRQEKMEEAKSSLKSEMEEKAAALGLSLEGLFPRAETAKIRSSRKPRKDAGAPVPVKYRGPNGEEWTGRGRPPGWLAALEKQGKQRDSFRV